MTTTTLAPATVVTQFLDALARGDRDAALNAVTVDLEYINVSLPTIHGRAGLAKAFGPLWKQQIGFDVRIHHIATELESPETAVVLTDRTDEISLGRFRQRFWVYGRFVVRDGQIAVWRDSFDWIDILRSTGRGLLGIVSPGLNRPL